MYANSIHMMCVYTCNLSKARPVYRASFVMEGIAARVSTSLQLFDELLEQLRDTALKSVNGDVSLGCRCCCCWHHTLFMLVCWYVIAKHVDMLTS